MTGRGVRVAILDSGVHASHPHVRGVAGGIAFDENGCEHGDYIDRLGHGTAVTAAIKEKAPDAGLYAVKVFDRVLSTHVTNLIKAIDWAASAGMHVANLSLGTANPEHEALLRDAVDRAAVRGLVIVAAREEGGPKWWPGSLPNVVPVQLDWACPRDEYRVAVSEGVTVFRASGIPRQVPGVPPEQNLNGVSFAVANMTGFVARVHQALGGATRDAIVGALESGAPVTDWR